MNRILLIAHAPLAQALYSCALHVFSDSAQKVLVLDVAADEPFEQSFAKAKALLAQNTNNVLVLTDVFGATPSNVAQKLIQHFVQTGIEVREITGVNLPMLLRAICYAALPLQELEQYALTGGAQGMFTVDIATGAPVCTLAPVVQENPFGNSKP